MKQQPEKGLSETEDPLATQVYEYLKKFDFPLVYLIQRKFKIGFSQAERILKQIEAKRKAVK
jgi:DNA segregation ATPase FtsK/SpoIIIE-like protein